MNDDECGTGSTRFGTWFGYVDHRNKLDPNRHPELTRTRDQPSLEGPVTVGHSKGCWPSVFKGVLSMNH